jgi:integrase
VPLKLYRRHRLECEGGHPEDSRSGEFEEGRRGWKRCACIIHASGTIGGKYNRRQTGKSNWAEAKFIAAAWEACGSWDINPQPHALAAPLKDRFTITEATEAFLAKCQNRGIVEATIRKYKTFIKQLLAYCHQQGYVYIDQLTIIDGDRFYASWKDGVRAKAKKLDKFRSFAKFCIKRKWTAENIAEDLEAPQGSSLAANQTPFSDHEIHRMIAACDIFGPPVPQGPGYRPWGGEDAKDFIYLSIYSGLRISDVCLFDVSKRLVGNDLFLRQHKTKKDLYTWIPDWLTLRLRDREKRYGPSIFLPGKSTNIRTVTEQWRRRLKKIFKLERTVNR